MGNPVGFFLLIWTALGCLNAFVGGSEVTDSPDNDLLGETRAASTVENENQGVPDPETAEHAHSSEEADKTSAAIVAARPNSLSPVKCAEASGSPAEVVTGAESESRDTRSESVAMIHQDADSASGVEGATGTLVPPTGVSDYTDAEPVPSGALHSQFRESMLSTGSGASTRTSSIVVSDDGNSTSGTDSATSGRMSWTPGSGDEGEKSNTTSILSFLREGDGEFEESDSAQAAESSDAPQGEAVLEELSPRRKKGFLEKMQRTFRRARIRCKWDVSKRIVDKDHAISLLNEVSTEVRRATKASALSFRKSKPLPPFDAQVSPDMILAAFLQSSAKHLATGVKTLTFSGPNERIFSFRSVTHGTVSPVAIVRLVSDEPHTYEVLMDGVPYNLVTVPLYDDFEKLKSAVITEHTRVLSYIQAARLFRLSSADELLQGYRWNLLLDVLILPKADKAPITFGDGEPLAKHFVLKQKATMTLRDFIAAATLVENHEPELVYLARTSVSLQLLKLMSAYAQLNIVFPIISVSDFEISEKGILRLSTVSPWYRGGGYYKVIDARSGMYAKVHEAGAKTEERPEILFLSEEITASNLVQVILSIWCGEEKEEGATAETALKERLRAASELLQSQAEQNCVPGSLAVLLSKLVLQDDDARLPLSQTMGSAEWVIAQDTLQQGMQFYDFTRAT